MLDLQLVPEYNKAQEARLDLPISHNINGGPWIALC